MEDNSWEEIYELMGCPMEDEEFRPLSKFHNASILKNWA
jgi:hypothetical protein